MYSGVTVGAAEPLVFCWMDWQSHVRNVVGMMSVRLDSGRVAVCATLGYDKLRLAAWSSETPPASSR